MALSSDELGPQGGAGATAEAIGRFLRSPRVLTFVLAYAVFVMAARVGIELLKLKFPLDLPLFSDFVCYWSAGGVVFLGSPELVYDYSYFNGLQQTSFGHDGLPFFYPPTWLLLVTPFALLPYELAAILFQALCVTAAGIACALLARNKAAGWMVFAFPAMIFGIMIGQNSLLNVALFAGSLAALDRKRPILAGILIGLMAYKPQVGLLIPFAFLAGREYRAFAGAAATVLVVAAISLLAFGAETWTAFIGNIAFANDWLMSGQTPAFKYASMLGWLRQFGIGNDIGYPVQLAFAAFGLACTVWCWRQPVPLAVKGAVLVSATCLSTPYLLDYDLALLAIPLLLIVRLGEDQGYLPLERTAVAVAALSLLATSGWGVKMDVTAIGVAPLTFMALSLRRAVYHCRHDGAAATA